MITEKELDEIERYGMENAAETIMELVAEVRSLHKVAAAAPDFLELAQRLVREEKDGEYTIGLLEDARDVIAKALD